ncbi:AAA family ATPase [Rhabdochromatium marinum]|uniref:AAA family ATPase n=1 Tax=Rhabdochromatium marinum TaxID=48729 RepID=UPI0019072A07|nr:AAA family ATPase [Rhabdochromatium marinum]MBK1648481.1 hypothetical protein [Rhabdochromatium marinum]
MPLTAECLKRLSLQEQPFAPDSRGAFLYRDAQMQDQLGRMQQTLVKPGAILLLSASSGAGRSIQLMRLLSALPKHFEIIAFRGRNNTSFASVEVTIRKHLKTHGENDPSRPLNELLIERGHRKINTVIVVDDAHLLGSDILRQLLKLGEDANGATHRGPRLLLMGDAVLGRNYPRMLIVNDTRQVRHISLPPFTQEQAAAYLRHRLTAAGNAAIAKLFTLDVVTKLHKSSRGLPRDLNTVAEQWLSENCQPPEQTEATAAAAVATAAAEEEKPKEHPPAEPAAEEGATTAPEAAQETSSELEADSEPEAPSNLDETAPSTHAPPAPEKTAPKDRKAAVAFWKQPWFLATATSLGLGAFVFLLLPSLSDNKFSFEQLSLGGTTANPSQQPADDANGDAADSGGDTNADATATAPDTPENEATPDAPQGDNTAETANRTPEGKTAASTQPPAPDEQTSPETTRPPKAANRPQASSTSASATPPTEHREPEQNQTPAASEEPTTTEAMLNQQRAYTRADLSWLAQQDPNHYTIQLIALPKIAAVKDYINTHLLEGARVISTRSLAIAVYGSFPDINSTMVALTKIPQDMLAQGYWIRTIADVQAEVR